MDKYYYVDTAIGRDSHVYWTIRNCKRAAEIEAARNNRPMEFAKLPMSSVEMNSPNASEMLLMTTYLITMLRTMMCSLAVRHLIEHYSMQSFISTSL